MERTNLAYSEKPLHVKGSLFRDYVRMIKKHKDIDWSRYLTPSDMEYINHGIITVVEWYPLESFQSMGRAVFHELAHSKTEVAKEWGRRTMDTLAELYGKNLVVAGDPFLTVKKFIDMQRYFFDFEGFETEVKGEQHIDVRISSHFGFQAVEGYSWQMLGAFERLIELTGARYVKARFSKRAWTGDRSTVIELHWS